MDLTDPNIGEAYRHLTSGNIGWFILGTPATTFPRSPGGSSSKIRVIDLDKDSDQLHDSLQALRISLHKVADFCHVIIGSSCLVDDLSGRRGGGQVLLTFLPKQFIFGVKRAQAISQARSIAGSFKGVCSTMEISSPDELVQEDLQKALQQGRVTRKASGSLYRVPSGAGSSSSGRRHHGDSDISLGSGPMHSRKPSLSSTTPLGMATRRQSSQRGPEVSSPVTPGRPDRKTSLRATASDQDRVDRQATSLSGRAEDRRGLYHEEPRPISRLPDDIYGGFDDTLGSLRPTSTVAQSGGRGREEDSQVQDSMRMLSLGQDEGQSSTGGPPQAPPTPAKCHRSTPSEVDTAMMEEEDIAKRSSSVLFRKRTTRRPDQMASVTDGMPAGTGLQSTPEQADQDAEDDRAAKIRREIYRRQKEVEEENRRREEEEERLRGIVRRREEMRLAEENERRRQAEMLEAERLEIARLEEQKAYEDAEIRRLIEEARYADEQVRLETNRKMQENNRREAIEASLVQILMSGRSLNSGQISVQHGTSAVWRMRNYELTSTALALYKNAQAQKPLCVLQLTDLRTITDHPEEVSIANGFKLGFSLPQTDSPRSIRGEDEEEEEDEFLFFCSSETEKDELIENLQSAAEAIEAEEEEQNKRDELQRNQEEQSQVMEPEQQSQTDPARKRDLQEATVIEQDQEYLPDAAHTLERDLPEVNMSELATPVMPQTSHATESQELHQPEAIPITPMMQLLRTQNSVLH